MSVISSREFEASALAFLVSRPLFFASKKDSIKDVNFEDKKLKLIFNRLVDSHNKYSTFPTKDELLHQVKTFLIDKNKFLDLEWEEYSDLIEEVYRKEVTENTGEEINKILADQKRKKLADKLLSASVDTLHEVSREIEAELKKFRRVVYQDTDLGLNFFSSAGVSQVIGHISDYNKGTCVRTGFPYLDEAMVGGTRLGELNAILGTTGVGKTTTLINFAKGFVEDKARTVYIYLDSLKSEFATRAASCWLGESIDYSTDLTLIQQRLQGFLQQHEGMLWTQQFPGHSMTVADIDEYITNLEAYLYEYDKERNVLPKEKWGKIQVLILDYLDLLVYDSNTDSFKIEEYKAGELNALCIRHDLACWTGTQGGTNAMKTDRPKLYDAHGYKSRFHPMANVLILCCQEDDRMKLRRDFTMEFGKARRPLKYTGIPFTMDVITQRICEDKDRQPQSSTEAPDAPPQDATQTKGSPVAPMPYAEFTTKLHV